jgi:hypothetical protein
MINLGMMQADCRHGKYDGLNGSAMDSKRIRARIRAKYEGRRLRHEMDIGQSGWGHVHTHYHRHIGVDTVSAANQKYRVHDLLSHKDFEQAQA